MKSETRREFLRGLGRGTILGGLGLLAGVVAGRRRGSDRERHVCVNRGICSGCTRLDGCPLPPARSRRQREGRT